MKYTNNLNYAKREDFASNRMIQSSIVFEARNIIGSTIAYFIGKSVGREGIIRYGSFVGITSERFDRAEEKFKKYSVTLLFAKFITGVRVLVAYLASLVDCGWIFTL